jgi:hypothetical protein
LLRVLAPRIAGLASTGADAAIERALASGDADLASAVQLAVLGLTWQPGEIAVFDPARVARPALLARLAKHAKAGDPLLTTALGAVVVRSGIRAPRAIAEILDATPPARRAAIRDSLGQVHMLLGPDPAWVDLFAPALATAARAPYPVIALLSRWRDPTLVARCLTHQCSDASVLSLLGLLRQIKDASIGPTLQALASGPRWKGTASGRRIAELAKEMGGAATVGVELTREVSVGTDGGPVVLVPAAIASQWTGTAPPEGRVVRTKHRFDRLDAPATDYDEACAQRGVALLPREGGAVLVLRETSAWIGRHDDGTLWCVLAGSPELLAKHGASLRKWKAVKGRFTVGAGGAILLDAALSARKKGGNRARVKIAAGDYRVDVALVDDDRGEMHVARLRRLA